MITPVFPFTPDISLTSDISLSLTSDMNRICAGLAQGTHPTAAHRSEAMAAATQHLLSHDLITRVHGDLFPMAPAYATPDSNP